MHNMSRHNPAKQQYKCDMCTFETRANASLKLHKRNKHAMSNKPQFKCNLCLSQFSSKSHVKKHIGATHLTEEYPCHYCDKIFKSRGNLQNHEKFVHLEVGNYKCTVCRGV